MVPITPSQQKTVPLHDHGPSLRPLTSPLPEDALPKKKSLHIHNVHLIIFSRETGLLLFPSSSKPKTIPFRHDQVVSLGPSLQHTLSECVQDVSSRIVIHRPL